MNMFSRVLLSACLAVVLFGSMAHVTYADHTRSSNYVSCPRKDPGSVSERRNLLDRASGITFKVFIKNESKSTEKALGTATLISNEGHVITARHLFDIDNGLVRKQLKSGKASLVLRSTNTAQGMNTHYEFKAELEAETSESPVDAAILRITDWKNQTELKPMVLNFTKERIVFKARFLGWKLESDKISIAWDGNVEHSDGHFLRITRIPGYHGYSGSLVLNEEGHGFGLVSGRYVGQEKGGVKKWIHVDDIDNRAMNVVDVRYIVDLLLKAKSGLTGNVIRDLRKSAQFRAARLNQILQKNPVAAFAICQKLKALENGIKNSRNRRNAMKFCGCIYEPSSTFLDKLMDRINNLKYANRSKEMKLNLALTTLERARASYKQYRKSRSPVLLARSLNLYRNAEKLASKHMSAAVKKKLGEMYLEYYAVAKSARRKGVRLPKYDQPVHVLERGYKVANSGKVLLALTPELIRQKRFKDATLIAAAALNSSDVDKSRAARDYAHTLNIRIMNAETGQEKSSLIAMRARLLKTVKLPTRQDNGKTVIHVANTSFVPISVKTFKNKQLSLRLKAIRRSLLGNYNSFSAGSNGGEYKVVRLGKRSNSLSSFSSNRFVIIKTGKVKKPTRTRVMRAIATKRSKPGSGQ